MKVVLTQINEWLMSTMKILQMGLPVIPFLSLFIAVAGGNAREMLQGWKFIAGSYIAYTAIVALKALKAAFATKISISELWRTIWPAVMIAFSTGSTSAAMHKAKEISEKEFHIKPEFTSFWIPMGAAMLNPKTTVNVVIACFMAAHITGMTVTTSFLAVLILVVVELSIACPGTAAAWTIMFETLSMPTGYVGLFSICRMFTANYGAGCVEAYMFMEEVGGSP